LKGLILNYLIGIAQFKFSIFVEILYSDQDAISDQENGEMIQGCALSEHFWGVGYAKEAPAGFEREYHQPS
jgi:hypothetical protein